MQNVTGFVVLTLFILAIAIAEWKKDFWYHLMAVIIGIYGLTNITDTFGVNRIIIIMLMVYQLYRMFRIYKNSRNTLQAESE